MAEQLDLLEALRLKEAGLDAAAKHNETWCQTARRVAHEICLQRGEVTADEVRCVLYPLGIKPDHYNAWGSVFRHFFEDTGRTRVSAVPEGHGNRQRVWRIASLTARGGTEGELHGQGEGQGTADRESEVRAHG